MLNDRGALRLASPQSRARIGSRVRASGRLFPLFKMFEMFKTPAR